MRRLIWVLPLVAVFVATGIALFRSAPGDVGRPAPDFALPSLDGGTVELSRLRGKPVVLNFWASWCDPCRDEAPELARTARKLGRPVHFLGVNILDGREEALDYVGEFRVPYESARDARGVVAKRYKVTGVPETVFIDARGTIVGKYIGAFREGQLAELVRRLIALSPGDMLVITGRGETRPVP